MLVDWGFRMLSVDLADNSPSPGKFRDYSIALKPRQGIVHHSWTDRCVGHVTFTTDMARWLDVHKTSSD